MANIQSEGLKAKNALIPGITWQDGAYPAEFLLTKCYDVHRSKRRELLLSDDLSDACMVLMSREDTFCGPLPHEDFPPSVNIGVDEDVTLQELETHITKIVASEVSLPFDTTEPDGNPSKLLNFHRLRGPGWQHKASLEEGIRRRVEAWHGGMTVT